MKYLIAFLLMVQLALADGYVLYERNTGALYGDDNGTVTRGWQKLQPPESHWDSVSFMGSQVVGVNWQIHDVAKFGGKRISIPQTTNDLTDVVPMRVYEAQTSKKSKRYAKENEFFALVKAVLVLANDPRKDIVPTPKLDRDELDAILDALYEQPSTKERSTKYSMKLMNVDNALSRFDKDWWDTATQH